MQAFKSVTGVMAHLPIANIDTDMIIPKQYLKTIKRTGLGQYLFAELRYDLDHVPNKNFILNHSKFKNAKILLTEENFGCGSSREHAVWSLMDFGITVVIAPSFADIFYSNCFKNGLLPICLPEPEIQMLIQEKYHPVTINLETKIIQTHSRNISFHIDEDRRWTLLNGLDEISETLVYEKMISAFESEQQIYQPWLYSGVSDHA